MFKEGDKVRAIQDDDSYWEGVVCEVTYAIYGIKNAQGSIRWFNYQSVLVCDDNTLVVPSGLLETYLEH